MQCLLWSFPLGNTTLNIALWHLQVCKYLDSGNFWGFRFAYAHTTIMKKKNCQDLTKVLSFNLL